MVFEALGVLMAATVQGVFVNSTRVAGDCAKNGEESSTVAPEQLNDEVFFPFWFTTKICGEVIIIRAESSLVTNSKK